jgi:hypothetical protein
MSGQIVNLNRARKSKARTDKEKRAAENRARFGEPKSSRQKRDAESALNDGALDGHRRTPTGQTPPDHEPTE